MVQLSKKYRHVYQKLTNFELQLDKPSNRLISMDDIMGDLAQKERPHLFLDFYSTEGIYKALDTYGIFNDLRKRGFKNFVIDINTKDPYRHIFRTYYEKKKSDHLLCEAYFRKKSFIAKPIFKSTITGEQFTLIVIEWLSLQDPTAEFTKHRPQLPGQKYPGLRIGRKVLEILINMCLRLKTDGLLNIPEHYHNAVFYGKYFKYFNPQTEGYFQAIQRDLKLMRLNEVAWAIEWGCLIERLTNKYWKWFTDEQILPVSKKMEDYFCSSDYEKIVKKASRSVQFKIDKEKFNEMNISLSRGSIV